VKRIVDAVPEERIAAIEKKLENFETSNIVSDPDHPPARLGFHGKTNSYRDCSDEYVSANCRV
jgi:hypothetical protein